MLVRRVLAWGTLLLGVGFSLVSEAGWVRILRDVLRFQCEPVSDAVGGWLCAEGIEYRLPGLSLLLIQVCIGAVALLALAWSRRSRIARRVLAASGAGALLVTVRAIAIAGGTDEMEDSPFPVAVGLLAACAAAAVLAAVVLSRTRLAIVLLAGGAVLAIAAAVVVPALFAAGVLGAGCCAAAALAISSPLDRPGARPAASVGA